MDMSKLDHRHRNYPWDYVREGVPGQLRGVFIGGNTNKTILYQGDNTITAGEGSSALVGSAYGTSVLTAKGSAGDVLIAGEYGHDTLSGGASTGNNLLQGYLGAFTPSDDPRNPSPTAVMTAGQGNDTLVAAPAPRS